MSLPMFMEIKSRCDLSCFIHSPVANLYKQLEIFNSRDTLKIGVSKEKIYTAEFIADNIVIESTIYAMENYSEDEFNA